APTAAAVWVSLWVSTPMTTSRSGWRASMLVHSLAERTSIPARATLRQDCDEPHPEADKLLIRPTRQPGPAPAARTDKSHSGHHKLGRSVFGSRAVDTIGGDAAGEAS